MGELVFIGLGLHDEKGVTLRGLEDAHGADVVFAELYTSTLAGAQRPGARRSAAAPRRTGVTKPVGEWR